MCQTYSEFNCNTAWSLSQYYLLISAPVLSPTSEECNFSADIFIETWEIFRFWMFFASTQKRRMLAFQWGTWQKDKLFVNLSGVSGQEIVYFGQTALSVSFKLRT